MLAIVRLVYLCLSTDNRILLLLSHARNYYYVPSNNEKNYIIQIIMKVPVEKSFLSPSLLHIRLKMMANLLQM